MGRLKEDQIKAAFLPHLHEGEALEYWAAGIKQPNLILIPLLGLIASMLLTKNYLVGLTDRRLVVLQVKSLGNAEGRQIVDYSLDELGQMETKMSNGMLFTHLRIDDSEKPFAAKFHRAFSKTNRPNAMAIGEAIISVGAS